MGEDQKSIQIRQTYFEKDQWLSRFGEQQRELIENCIDQVVKFSEGKYHNFFKYCSLYACGSSLTDKIANDVDLVLVGLDFRSIIKYDKVFLKDPKTLIEKEILIEPVMFEVVKTGENGEPEILQDISEDSIEYYGRHGLEFEGKLYQYNINRFLILGLSLENYCAKTTGYSPLVKEFFSILMKNVAHEKQNDFFDFTLDPFETYFHQEEYFLTTPLSIIPLFIDFSPDQLVPKNLKLKGIPLDFRIHTENMLVPAWEQYQKQINYPYILLHSWPNSNLTNSNLRPILTQEDQPSFIDKSGRERIKWDQYHSYLCEPPINPEIINVKLK